MKADIHAHLSAMLADYGVQYLFGMRIYEDLDTSRVRPINVHHETSAALMAYGYARVSGRPGVVTVNRAATPNVMMGLAEAHSSSVPVIVLLDGVPVAMEGKNAQFAQDQLGMLRPVTKWIGDATHLSMGPDMLAKAFRMATSGRPGPVVVSLRGAGPVFNQGHIVEAEPVSEPEWGVFPARRALPDPQSIDRAVELLRGAERPCIIAGGGVTLSQAWDELRELAELGQIPVAHTISGKGAFPERHPLSAGTTGGFAGMSGPLGRAAIAEKVVHDSDVVLLVGTRTNEMATNRWTVPSRDATIIHLDIDQEEIGRNYRTAVGVAADAKAGLRALVDALRADYFEPPPSADERKEDIRQALEQWREAMAPLSSSTSSPVHPARLVAEVSEVLGPDTILVSDGSSPFVWATNNTFVEAGPTFISPRGTGAIGTGLPMAMGAQLAAPDKRVICFEGDGGLMCGILPELEVAARYKIPVTVVVFNNGSFFLEKSNMRQTPLCAEMDFLPGLNFAAIARELKCEAFRVEQPSDIGPALRKAIDYDGPAVVDVVCAQEALPRLATAVETH